MDSSPKQIVEDDIQRVRQIALELNALASRLSLSTDGGSAADQDGAPDIDRIMCFLSKLKRVGELRLSISDKELFADPAWDMLIELSINQIHGRPISVSSLCVASKAPATTALRYISRMVEQGLLDREADPNDSRRI